MKSLLKRKYVERSICLDGIIIKEKVCGKERQMVYSKVVMSIDGTDELRLTLK